jgi:signal transduction histidine kinase
VEKNSQGEDVTVTISDTGSGIQEDILSRIFMKFVSKSRSGTVLGLFISKSIIEAHNGSIRGYNNPSGGATFTFTIPHKDTTFDTNAPRYVKSS